MFFSAVVSAAPVERVDIHPQCFDNGGWKTDVQFMDVMGSPYLLAHGCGIRVLDATARIEVPSAGEWRVWVRSRKWTDGAGAFKVRVGENLLGRTFGVSQSEWAWEDGGIVSLKAGTAKVTLEDQDGFDGRCAGVVLVKNGSAAAAPVGALDVRNVKESETVEVDFVVVGGGLPGTCAAVAAARRGLKVALVQDRPVLGGNASSEIRVWSAGEARYPLVRELRGWFMNRDPNMALSDANRMRVVQDERTLSLHLCTRMFAAETEGGVITAVKAFDWKRNRVVRFRAPLFCDATGDGWLGYYAGADWRMGREAKSEFDESFAPEKADNHTLGASLMWTSASANTSVPFTAPWAEKHAQGVVAVRGEWNWEYGVRRNMISEAEAIRDRLFLAIYGSFSLAKKDPVNARLVLDNVPFLLGKRESRRILGDWIYSEKDVTGNRAFEDAVASGSWSVDLHYDDRKPGVDFLTTCRQPHFGRYWIPYRSIYSRNVSNMFMVGRCFSCTHVGLGGPRVINTLSQLGCAAGEAAAMCKERGCLPRDIWRKGFVRELQRRLGGDFPGNPDPEMKGWLIVDDESQVVEFAEGWKEVDNPNGEQIGQISHVPAAAWKPGRVSLEAGSKTGDALYPLPIPAKGRYALRFRVPYQYSVVEDSVTEAEIVSGGKAVSFTMNQALDTGTWRDVGRFELEPGAVLKIKAAKSRGTVIADAFAVKPLFDVEETVLRPLDVQGMIDAAGPGGTVRIPPGDWEVRPFRLKSDLTLEFSEGAVIYASTNINDYAAAEGQRVFIGAVDAVNVTMRGPGVIDGRGSAFREKVLTDGASQPQRLPVMMRFIRCRNLKLEDFTYRQSGAWGCHLCNCDGVTVRRLKCFNHANHTNDGIDVESSNVLIEDCLIDADDDAIVFKTETDKSFAVTNALIRNCVLRSCCNALKFGTGSYGRFSGITLENCRFERARGSYCFGWNRYQKKSWPDIPGVTNSLCGIAGMAIECVDGGSLENVTVRNVTVDGYMTPIFIRHARRHEPPRGKETFLRNVLIENIEATVADSRIACSITGVPGRRVSDVTLRNVSLKFPGGGTSEDAAFKVPEKERDYPEAFMFDFQPLPAWAFYIRHADRIRFENVRCELLGKDARNKFTVDDAELFVDGRIFR